MIKWLTLLVHLNKKVMKNQKTNLCKNIEVFFYILNDMKKEDMCSYIKHKPIVINVGSFTYQDKYGTYQLNHKKWVEELSHKNFLTEYGVTKIIKYQ